MRHFLIIALLLINLAPLLSQQFEEFTSYEINLIQSGNENDLMRVYNLSSAEDSIILKSTSIEISPTHLLTQLLAKRMLETVQNPEHLGVGIAAPQVGINRRIMVVQRFDKEENPFEVFINPIITWESEIMQLGPEGDLSFDERGSVFRNYIIAVQYYDLNGNTIDEIIEGFTAVIFQHERDHLDGILLTDKVKSQVNIDFIESQEKSKLYFKAD
mgnify:FL=1